MVKALINSGNEVNAMQPSFTKKLGFHVCKIDVSAQKIDGSRLETFGMVIVSFLVENKDGRSCFFEKISLLADIIIDIALGISFLTLCNIKVNFNN